MADAPAYLVIKLPPGFNQRRLVNLLSGQGIHDLSFVRDLWSSKFFNNENRPGVEDDEPIQMYSIPPITDEEPVIIREENPNPEIHLIEQHQDANAQRDSEQVREAPAEQQAEHDEEESAPQEPEENVHIEENDEIVEVAKENSHVDVQVNEDTRSSCPSIEVITNETSSPVVNADLFHDDIDDFEEETERVEEHTDTEGDPINHNDSATYVTCVKCGSNMKSQHAFNLTDHVRRRHASTRQFGCSVCSYTTSKKSQIFKHIKALHKGKGQMVDNKNSGLEEEWKQLVKECFPTYEKPIAQRKSPTLLEVRIKYNTNRSPGEALANGNDMAGSSNAGSSNFFRNFSALDESQTSPRAPEVFEFHEKLDQTTSAATQEVAQSTNGEMPAPALPGNIQIKQEVDDESPYPSNDFLNLSFHDGGQYSADSSMQSMDTSRTSIMSPRRGARGYPSRNSIGKARNDTTNIVINCQKCTRTFRHGQLQFHKLFLHAQTHHQVRAYGCPLCPFNTYYPSLARQHLKNIHEVGKEMLVDKRTPLLVREWRELAKECFPSLAEKAASFKFKDCENF